MILVVDDEQGIVQTLRTALELEGFRVETAGDGVEAFRHLRDPDCRCMLLDLRMPRVGGAELLLLMQSEGIRVPTIVTSGFKDFEEDEMKQFANVVAFFQKPFELDELLQAVRKHACRTTVPDKTRVDGCA